MAEFPEAVREAVSEAKVIFFCQHFRQHHHLCQPQHLPSLIITIIDIKMKVIIIKVIFIIIVTIMICTNHLHI